MVSVGFGGRSEVGERRRDGEDWGTRDESLHVTGVLGGFGERSGSSVIGFRSGVHPWSRARLGGPADSQTAPREETTYVTDGPVHGVTTTEGSSSVPPLSD